MIKTCTDPCGRCTDNQSLSESARNQKQYGQLGLQLTAGYKQQDNSNESLFQVSFAIKVFKQLNTNAVY